MGSGPTRARGSFAVTVGVDGRATRLSAVRGAKAAVNGFIKAASHSQLTVVSASSRPSLNTGDIYAMVARV